MMKTSETIVFFGSGPVAATSLALLAKDFVIEAVVTKPQPAHHKQAFPVLKLADELGLKVCTPINKKELSELIIQSPFNSRLGIVIDYGIIIDESVIDSFSKGIINSHFSLLPKWRGADPISFAILSGEPTTGVSIMRIVKALDEGPLFSQEELNLLDDEAAPELTARLVELSHRMLVKIVPEYLQGSIEPKPQDSVGISYSRKLTKADGLIDWNMPAKDLDRQVRAFIEWPRSYTSLGGNEVIVTKTKPVEGSGEPGRLLIDKHSLGVFTGDGVLQIMRLVPSGKREMDIISFMAGYKIKN
jgi:methionyl-tRNA formyltransferase